jgi:hypothetical protein
MTQKQVTVIVFTLLLAFLAISISRNKAIADEFTDLFFEPNTRCIEVECFGNQGQGYWDGAANRPSHIVSTGPPIGGTQSASYQLYQQAVNAATPTLGQLEKASNLPGGGYGYINTPEAPGLLPPSGKNTFYDAAAVNFNNRRAELISPCAINAPTFVASSLLPKIDLPGVPSWNVMDTQALANQDFLAPTQQIGVDTVLSSKRNTSYDIRNNIPNPINVVSPWLNSTITPDLQRRPLDSYVPQDGIYGCGMSCSYPNPSRSPL